VRRLRWTWAAAEDLEQIRRYLESHQPHLAQQTVIHLYNAIRELKSLPHQGREGRIEGTRELVF
jgi:plasmid stabilization system protein ParE